MFKHILIAHDLRDTADMALCRASQLAKQHGSHLTLLHVLDPSQNSGQHEKTRQALDRSLTQYAPPGTELRMLSGKPSEVVLQQVQDSGCDLLVLGGHQQRHDFFSGTSLDRIARRCTVPLLLVARNDFNPYQRALAAIDFSLCACSALGQAYRLLPGDAELHALHVFEPDKGTPQQVELQLQTQRGLNRSAVAGRSAKPAAWRSEAEPRSTAGRHPAQPARADQDASSRTAGARQPRPQRLLPGTAG